MAGEGDGLALDEADANLIGEDAHDGCVLDPRNSFKLFAALADGYEEDVAPDVFAKDGKHLGAADFSKTGGLDVAGAGDAKTGITLEISFEEVACGGNAGEAGLGFASAGESVAT